MSFLTDRIVVLGILCCIFLLTNEVQCKRRSGSSSSSSSSRNPEVTTSTEKPRSPDVNVYSLKRSGFDHDHVSVYAGHSYVIICRIDASFKVRSFVFAVLMTNSNTSIWTQPAVDNAAHFFPPIQPPIKNNGFAYSCQYNSELKPETFSYSDYRSITFIEPSYARLVGGESRCMGSLELEHEGEWRTVSQKRWRETEAAVVCRQLDCGHVISTDTQRSELQPVWTFFSDCDGSETALLSCGSVREGKSASNVHVLCSDLLHPANIGVAAEKTSTAVNSTVVYSPYSFYIKCSVLPQFSGGHFSLVFTGVKKSLTLNQIGANHSAVFTFASAEKSHSGNYSCIYHISVHGHSFSSQSKEISIAVEDAEDVLLDDGVARDSDSTVCSGTLLVKDQSQTMMVTVQTKSWDRSHAAVVCRQLGCGSAVSTSIVQIPTVRPVWRFFSDCDGSEAALLQCGHVQKWFASNVIKVVCEG